MVIVFEINEVYLKKNNFSTVNRRCMFSTKVKELEIPAGVSVTVDVLSLHYDQAIWGPVDPEEFYPLRYIKNKKFYFHLCF